MVEPGQLRLRGIDRDRLQQEPACASLPGVEGVLTVCGDEHDVGPRRQLEQFSAEIEPARTSHLDVEKGNRDKVGLRVGKRIGGSREAGNDSFRHRLLQHRNSAGKRDALVVHNDDLGRLISLNGVEQCCCVNVQTLRNMGNDAEAGYAIA